MLGADTTDATVDLIALHMKRDEAIQAGRTKAWDFDASCKIRGLLSDPFLIFVVYSQPKRSRFPSRAQPPTHTRTQDLLVKSKKKSAESRIMYLFKIVFTWRSLAVHVLLLSVITTVIALPINSSTKLSEETRERDGKKARSDLTVSSSNPESHDNTRTPKKQKTAGSSSNEAGPSGNVDIAIAEASDAKSSEAPSKPQELIIAVIIEGGKELWNRGEDVNAEATWFMAIVAVEQFARIGRKKDRPRVYAYQTISEGRTEGNMESQFNSKWTRRRIATKNQNDLYGKQIDLSPQHLIFEIARVTTTSELRTIRHKLFQVMRQRFGEYHSDRLPNVPSIYQSVLLLHNATLHEPDVIAVQPKTLEISESSGFGKAFYKMVEKKGTGVGQKLSVKEKWEWELYKRITSGAIVLKDSLLEHKNKDILEDLWDEVYEVPWELLHGQDIDLDPKWKDRESWGNVLDEPFDPLRHTMTHRDLGWDQRAGR
ncbi:hypothetical protein C8R42DRAFT_725650 [Lentinula raphanica]|nr:hypothetical protein C8R42DRAFT_725650 [Lentinula raphanica]